jgi:hypothetical protein
MMLRVQGFEFSVQCSERNPAFAGSMLIRTPETRDTKPET